MKFESLLTSLTFLVSLTSAAPGSLGLVSEERSLLNPYAPAAAACPSTPLIRSASSGINPLEAAYIAQRYALASKSFASFLAKTDPTFPVLQPGQYPKIGLANGGGGARGWLISAGVHKAFDAGEPDAASYSTSGLYQSITYEAALSGTAIMLYSYVQNNWPLTSTLLSQLWVPSLSAGLTHPPGGFLTNTAIATQILGKMLTGFPTSITDTWGRILSYGSYLTSGQGISATVSAFTQLSGMTSFTKPYPIITALGIENYAAGCGLPPANATQYEFTPHEFGSHEPGVNNFIQMHYLGTKMNKGVPASSSGLACTTGFDNVGWSAATSSSTFNQPCGAIPNGFDELLTPLNLGAISNLFSTIFRGTIGTVQQYLYSLMPNPFANLASAPRVSSEGLLTLIDGGESIQVPPLWPFLYRDVDALIILDNSADNPANYQPNPSKPIAINYPSGEQIWNTVIQAQANGLSNRLPAIPDPTTFMANNYNKNPMTYFGCELTAKSPAMFFIYLPNRQVVFDTNIRASNLTFPPAATQGIIANGEAIATNNGDPNFARCIACGLMRKSALNTGAKLPAGCAACFATYCAKW